MADPLKRLATAPGWALLLGVVVYGVAATAWAQSWESVCTSLESNSGCQAAALAAVIVFVVLPLFIGAGLAKQRKVVRPIAVAAIIVTGIEAALVTLFLSTAGTSDFDIAGSAMLLGFIVLPATAVTTILLLRGSVPGIAALVTLLAMGIGGVSGVIAVALPELLRGVIITESVFVGTAIGALYAGVGALVGSILGVGCYWCVAALRRFRLRLRAPDAQPG